MKRKTSMLFPLLVAALALSACRPMPAGDAVANQGDGGCGQTLGEAQANHAPGEDGRQAATAAPVPYLTEPHWRETLAFGDFNIDIDLDVEAPEVGWFPVHTVERAEFTDGDERAELPLACLLRDVRGVRPGGDTKEEIRRIRQRILEGVYDRETGRKVRLPEEEIRRIIDEMETVYALAPTADSYEPALGLKPVATGTHWAYYLANGTEWDVLIEPDMLTVQRLPGGAVEPEPRAPEGTAAEGEARHPLERAELTQAEAEAVVADFLARANIGSFGISLIEEARIVQNYSGETISEGYRVECARVGCLPASSRQYDGGNGLRFLGDVYATAAPPETMTIYVDEVGDVYATAAPSETMTIYVDEGGIRQLVWADPLAIAEQAAENAELLPFGEIQSLIRQALRATLSRTGDEQSGRALSGGRVTRVVLSTCCIPQEDAPGRFCLTPAWFVLVSLNEREADGALPLVVAVNAVDGGCIAPGQSG